MPTIEIPRKESQVLKYYHAFEPLAEIYARQIYSAQKIGFEFDDLVQEFRIKIYTSIIAYAAKWAKYKKDGRFKPIPIEYYVKSALVNRSKDFIKQINNNPFTNISIEHDGFDYSVQNSIDSFSEISSKVLKYEINGVDLLQGLSHMQSWCFILYLKGWTIGKLQKMFRKKFEANKVIRAQIDFLQSKKHELLQNQTSVYKSYNVNLES